MEINKKQIMKDIGEFNSVHEYVKAINLESWLLSERKVNFIIDTQNKLDLVLMTYRELDENKYGERL